MAGHNMYEESPHIGSDEEGKKAVKKAEKKEAPEKGVKSEDFDAGEQKHAHERLLMHHKHMHEHMRMHEKHEMEHMHHEGDKGSLHKRHEDEVKEMHARHETESKAMHTKHQKEAGSTGSATVNEPIKMIDKKGGVA